MTAPNNKPITTDNLELFKAYRKKHSGWYRLHLVLGNANVKDSHVRECMELAQANLDNETSQLACILRDMSKSQRLKLIRTCSV